MSPSVGSVMLALLVVHPSGCAAATVDPVSSARVRIPLLARIGRSGPFVLLAPVYECWVHWLNARA